MNENSHFNQVFWLCAATVFVGVAYIFAITFIAVKNPRIADTAFGFFSGTLITGCIGYFIGGNPTLTTKKPPDPPVNTDLGTQVINTTTSTVTKVPAAGVTDQPSDTPTDQPTA